MIRKEYGMADWIIDKKDVESTVDGDFILFRNRPLVREDNVICYGSMDEKYVLQLIIMTEKDYKGMKVPDQVLVQLMATDPSVPQSSRVAKSAMKTGLNDAFDIGIAWLERYLAS